MTPVVLLLACGQELPIIGVDPAEDRPPIETPATPPPGGDGWVSVQTGRMHACAQDDAGALACWGCGVDPDRDGECGFDFDQAAVRALPVADYAVGADHTCWL